jgi:hypothetical protein
MTIPVYIRVTKYNGKGTRAEPFIEEPDEPPCCPTDVCGGELDHLRDEGPLNVIVCSCCETEYFVDATEHFVQTG